MSEKDRFLRILIRYIFFLLAIGTVFYVIRNFEKANPLVQLDITMNRETALEEAALIAEEMNIGPKNFRQAAAFDQDAGFQNFVELEAGGLEQFNKFIKEGYYHPFRWAVRHFKEQDPHEVVFWFKPDGEKYGFSEKVPESLEGASLSVEEARQTAEHHGVYNWDMDLENYSLVEKSTEDQVNGRTDHTFVYERKDVTAGEGKFRIRLVVSGDRLTAAVHEVKIPEDFYRRYKEMRSANDMIQMIGMGVVSMVYGLAGVIFGIFFLLRKRRLIWKPAVIAGFGIAFLSVFLLTLNSFPFSWFSYDTSLPSSSFITQVLLSGFFGFAGFGTLAALSFMAAEGLGRLAFPGHVQWWKIWAPNPGGSRQILNQTITGYLFAVFIVGFDVFFYMTTSSRLDWWSPAGVLTDPNILANYLPWLDSVAISLQAGFWEEAIFRALPISGIVLLTRKKKTATLWIILVLFIQTLIFGSAHASYPQQPSYARVAEMIIPFMIMGLIYIRFGILPAVIAHFTVDVFWISLPLWVTSEPGIWLDRILVVLFLFVPFWVIIFHRIKNRRWTFAEITDLNAGWSSPVIPESKAETDTIYHEEIHQPENTAKWIFPLALGGLVLWGLFYPLKPDAPPLRVSKTEAKVTAIRELKKRYALNPGEWTVLTSVADEADIRDIFAWKTGGIDNYRNMLNSWLAPPHWQIRLVKLEGRAEEKTEEYIAHVGNDLKIISTEHIIPEKYPGRTLSQEKAEKMADSLVALCYPGIVPPVVKISVTPEKLENRTDWEFVFADTLNYPLQKGQGRYLVRIAGDQVVSAYSFLHVPEEWIREYKKEESKTFVIKTMSILFVTGVILLAFVIAVIRWTKRKISIPVFKFTILLFMGFFILELILAWPELLSGYKTELPFRRYIVTQLTSLIIPGIFAVLYHAVFIAATPGWMTISPDRKKRGFLKSILLGIFVSGTFTAIQQVGIDGEPFWVAQDYLNARIPPMYFVISKIMGMAYYAAFGFILFSLVHKKNHGRIFQKSAGGMYFLIAGLAIAGISIHTTGFWLIEGTWVAILLMGVYWFYLRYHQESIPVVAGMIPVLQMAGEACISGKLWIIAGTIAGIAFSLTLFYLWYLQLLKYSEQKE